MVRVRVRVANPDPDPNLSPHPNPNPNPNPDSNLDQVSMLVRRDLAPYVPRECEQVRGEGLGLGLFGVTR